VSYLVDEIRAGSIVYWEVPDFFDLDYDPSILLHDSDGCEYKHERDRAAPGIVLTELRMEMRGPKIYDVLCADGIIRRIDSRSVWPADKN